MSNKPVASSYSSPWSSLHRSSISRAVSPRAGTSLLPPPPSSKQEGGGGTGGPWLKAGEREAAVGVGLIAPFAVGAGFPLTFGGAVPGMDAGVGGVGGDAGGGGGGAG